MNIPGQEKKNIDPKIRENHRRNWWSFLIFLLLVAVCIGIHIHYVPEAEKMQIRPQRGVIISDTTTQLVPNYARSPEKP